MLDLFLVVKRLQQPVDRAAAGRLSGADVLRVSRLERGYGDNPLIKPSREIGGHAIIDRLRRRDHAPDTEVEQVFGLSLGRTPIQEDELQSLLLPQKRSQSFRPTRCTQPEEESKSN